VAIVQACELSLGYLVRADGCGTTHCLTSCQYTNKVVVLHHLLHAVCQGDGDCQRQAFWDCHHHNGHTKDEEGKRAISNVLHWEAMVLNTPPALAGFQVNMAYWMVRMCQDAVRAGCSARGTSFRDCIPCLYASWPGDFQRVFVYSHAWCSDS